VPRFRLSGPAQADIAAVLRTSEARFGPQGRIRYHALLVAAVRRVAADPEGVPTVDRAELGAGIRSYHSRHASREAPVASPVHVLYYRALRPGVVEIVRVLHERLEPSRHLRVVQEDGDG